MKEDAMLNLMLKHPVVGWNTILYGKSLTREEFFSLAKHYHYQTSETIDGWYLAYLPPHNFESACAALGIYDEEKRAS
jgi:hypothetical protein